MFILPFITSGKGETPARVGACMVNEDHEHFLHIGKRAVWGGHQDFGLTPKDRAQHVYCLGKSGTGKTTLLRNLIVQDMAAGVGVGVIDLHGDLAGELLDYIPPSRIDDVVYFNAEDETFPIGLNPFHNVPRARRHLVASNIVGAFHGIWRASWGPRMAYVLYAAIATLIECPDTTLLGLHRIFVDPTYRHRVLRHVKDPMLLAFWTSEFDRWDPRLRNEILAPIQNKVGPLLMSPLMRNILGQVKRKIDFRFMMDHSRIFIANLSKGSLGEDKANLLGSLIVSEMQYAALGRANIDVSKRTPFCAYIDEFQNIQTDSFATILSEARKYGLALVLSNQFCAQLEDDVANAVFGNVGSIIAFRVGSTDAQRLAEEFGNAFPPSLFSSLPNYQVCVKMVRDGQVSEPFQGGTFASFGVFHGRRETIVNRSREKYGASRKVIEYKHSKWLES